MTRLNYSTFTDGLFNVLRVLSVFTCHSDTTIGSANIAGICCSHARLPIITMSSSLRKCRAGVFISVDLIMHSSPGLSQVSLILVVSASESK